MTYGDQNTIKPSSGAPPISHSGAVAPAGSQQLGNTVAETLKPMMGNAFKSEISKTPKINSPNHQALLKIFNDNASPNQARLFNLMKICSSFARSFRQQMGEIKKGIGDQLRDLKNLPQKINEGLTDLFKPIRRELGISRTPNVSQDGLVSLETMVEREEVIPSALHLLMHASQPEGKEHHLGKLPESINIMLIQKHFEGIKSAFDVEKSNLNPAELKNAESRMSELKEMVSYANQLEARSYKKEVIVALIDFRLELKSEGISAKFPKILDPAATSQNLRLHDPKNGQLNDENNQAFDNLRRTGQESDSSTTQLFVEFCAERGGDYNKIIASKPGESGNDYYAAQSGNSWSPMSCVVKHRLLNFKEIPQDELSNKFWFHEDYKKLVAQEGGVEQALADLDHTPEQVDKTLLMFMAFNAEFLEKTDLPGMNRENGTITIYRTETLEALKQQGITEVDDSEKSGRKFRRGPLESGSIELPVYATGFSVTVQQVPLVDVFCSYATEPMKWNSEREIVCMFGDTPMHYIKQHTPGEIKLIKKEIDRSLDSKNQEFLNESEAEAEVVFAGLNPTPQYKEKVVSELEAKVTNEFLVYENRLNAGLNYPHTAFLLRDALKALEENPALASDSEFNRVFNLVKENARVRG